MSKFEFPELEGWKTVFQVSEALGVSRQAVHKMLPSFGQDNVRQVGSGLKPVYLIRDTAVFNKLLGRNQHDSNQ